MIRTVLQWFPFGNLRKTLEMRANSSVVYLVGAERVNVNFAATVEKVFSPKDQFVEGSGFILRRIRGET